MVQSKPCIFVALECTFNINLDHQKGKTNVKFKINCKPFQQYKSNIQTQNTTEIYIKIDSNGITKKKKIYIYIYI